MYSSRASKPLSFVWLRLLTVGLMAMSCGESIVEALNLGDDLPPGVLGPKGGSVQSADGQVTVTFAPGALQGPTRVEVREVAGQRTKYLSPTYEVQPTGLRLDEPATISMNLQTTVTASVVMADLSHDDVLALPGSNYDRSAKVLTATTDRLGQYGAVERTKACVISGCGGQVCSDKEMFTTCEWQEGLACYKLHGQCGHHGPNGECRWASTQTLSSCLESPPKSCENGRQPGERFPAPDGCNTCECTEDGSIACTEMACGS